MALSPDMLNATIVRIERPVTTGVGGTVVNQTILVSNIPAHRQPFNAFATAGDTVVRDGDVEISRADNSFFIDLLDAQQLVNLVKAGDLVVWQSTRASGPVSNVLKDEVIRVNVWEALGYLREHVEMLVRGKAA